MTAGVDTGKDVSGDRLNDGMFPGTEQASLVPKIVWPHSPLQESLLRGSKKAKTPSDGVEAALKSINNDLDQLISGLWVPPETTKQQSQQFECRFEALSYSPQRKVRRPQHKSVSGVTETLKLGRTLSKDKLTHGIQALSAEGSVVTKVEQLLKGAVSMGQLKLMNPRSSRDQIPTVQTPTNKSALQIRAQPIRESQKGRIGNLLDYTVGFTKHMNATSLQNTPVLRPTLVSNLVKAAAGQHK